MKEWQANLKEERRQQVKERKRQTEQMDEGLKQVGKLEHWVNGYRKEGGPKIAKFSSLR